MNTAFYFSTLLTEGDNFHDVLFGALVKTFFYRYGSSLIGTNFLSVRV